MKQILIPPIASIILFAAVAPAMAADSDDETPPPVHLSNPFKDREEYIPKGKTLFNVHCSHCHGPNAVQGERKRDLRRLSLRYKERIEKVYITTTTNGRPDKGMPSWRDVVEEEELWKIFTFLETVQKQKKKRKKRN